MPYYRFSSTDPAAKTVESVDKPGDKTPSEPAEIAGRIRTWLQKNRVSVSLFSKQINRSQGTTSTLLNNPPATMLKGAEGEPWASMVKFLNSPSEQAMLVNARKGILCYKYNAILKCVTELSAIELLF